MVTLVQQVIIVRLEPSMLLKIHAQQEHGITIQVPKMLPLAFHVHLDFPAVELH